MRNNSNHRGNGTQRLTVGQAIVKFLSVQFSERDGREQRLIPGCFGIFGHGNVCGLGQALEEYGDDLPYYHCWNEQAMVHTAAGLAKATLRKQTLACTTSIGPGAVNMLTGAATATVNRLPVLLFPSDYFISRRQGTVLQQIEHPISRDVSVNDAFRPLCRFFDRPTRPEQVLTALPEAMRVLTDPAETGAVTISLPQDLQSHAFDWPSQFFKRRVWHIERRPPVRERIEELAQMLKQSKRPMIIAGGGVHYSEARDELKDFAETFGIPVSETFAGRGAMRGGSPMLIGAQGVEGAAGSAKCSAEADLVIAIGTRLADFATGSQSCFNNPRVKFAAINVAGHDAFKMGALPVVADAREALLALHEASRAAGIKPNKSRAAELAQLHETWAAQVQKSLKSAASLSQVEVVGLLNGHVKPEDTIVAAAGSVVADVVKFWDTSAGATSHLEFGFSCMGYEIPASLGVRMAKPKGEIYVLIGDGTYLMNPGELATAVQEDLKITIILLENQAYKSIRSLQTARAGPSFGNEFRHRESRTRRLTGEALAIDFAKNAESMGARTWSAASAKEFKSALDAARKHDGPGVIVVATDPDHMGPRCGIWWDAEPAEVSRRAAVKNARRAYESDRKKLQRFYY
jgi:3D-(3,5/4)-trihydroxycyclohexane-1,2-dione acylhydrolase (decyclizing)